MEAHIAIMRFATRELEHAARRVAHRLQREPASGIYGDDYGHKTLWSEFCFEVDNGPTDALEYAWSDALEPHISEVIAKTPDHISALISWHLASYEQEEPEDEIDTPALADAILSATKALAASEYKF